MVLTTCPPWDPPVSTPGPAMLFRTSVPCPGSYPPSHAVPLRLNSQGPESTLLPARFLMAPSPGFGVTCFPSVSPPTSQLLKAETWHQSFSLSLESKSSGHWLYHLPFSSVYLITIVLYIMYSSFTILSKTSSSSSPGKGD